MARAAVLGRLSWQLATVSELIDETENVRSIVLEAPAWPGHRVEARELRVELSDDEIAARLADWTPRQPRYADGVFAKYAALVSPASEGAITRPR